MQRSKARLRASMCLQAVLDCERVREPLSSYERSSVSSARTSMQRQNIAYCTMFGSEKVMMVMKARVALAQRSGSADSTLKALRLLRAVLDRAAGFATVSVQKM